MKKIKKNQLVHGAKRNEILEMVRTEQNIARDFQHGQVSSHKVRIVAGRIDLGEAVALLLVLAPVCALRCRGAIAFSVVRVRRTEHNLLQHHALRIILLLDLTQNLHTVTCQGVHHPGIRNGRWNGAETTNM